MIKVNSDTQQALSNLRTEFLEDLKKLSCYNEKKYYRYLEDGEDVEILLFSIAWKGDKEARKTAEEFLKNVVAVLRRKKFNIFVPRRPRIENGEVFNVVRTNSASGSKCYRIQLMSDDNIVETIDAGVLIDAIVTGDSGYRKIEIEEI